MERVEVEKVPGVNAQGGGETILVAEDDDALRKILVRYLIKLGYQVLEGENGAAAYQAAEKYWGPSTCS